MKPTKQGFLGYCTRLKLVFPLPLAVAVCLSGSTWYAAPDGSSTNGTSANPWSVPYAANNPHLKPGDTVLFKDGTFVCTTDSADYQQSNSVLLAVSGTPGSNITYKAENLWAFTVDGGFIVPLGVSNITIANMVFTYSGIKRNRTNESSDAICDMPPGINAFGGPVSIMHNLIDNTGHPAIGAWRTAGNKYIAGNITRFTGFYDWPPSGTVGHRGSGGYFETDLSGTNTVQGNIAYYEYTEGQYISQGGSLCDMNHNVMHQCFFMGLNYYSKHIQPNILKFQNNYVFEPETCPGAYAVKAGELTYPGNTRAIIGDNYLVGSLKGLSFEATWTNVIVTNNTVMKLGTAGDGGSPFATEYNIFQLEPLNIGIAAAYTISNNSYFTRATSSRDFMFWGNTMGFEDWKTNVTETGSSYTTNLPTAMFKDAFRPSTDSNFVHVVVFNWQTNASTTVDLSGFFSSGDMLKVYDAQDVPNSYTNFTYAGGSVPFELNRTNIAAMTGTFPEIASAWSGFDPRFRTFVVYRYGTAPTPLPPLGNSYFQRINADTIRIGR